MDFLTSLIQDAGRDAIDPVTAALAIAAIGLNIHFGFTGLLNMGQAGFMLIGAYGFAIPIKEGQPMIVGILCAFAAAFVLALILGIPTLRLRGDYLAIVTISAAEIVRYLGRAELFDKYTGGSNGIVGIAYRTPFTNLSFFGDGQTKIGPYELDDTGVDGWWLRFVAWTLVALLTLIAFLLVRSPWGRVLRGIREDEDAVRSLGKNVYAYKLQSLVIGGMFGAISGIIFVMPASVQADSMGRSQTFFIWTALLLGGAASIFGPVLGAVLFFVVRGIVQSLAGQFLPLNDQQTAQLAWVFVGVALMLLVIFRPQGALGNKRELRFDV